MNGGILSWGCRFFDGSYLFRRKEQVFYRIFKKSGEKFCRMKENMYFCRRNQTKQQRMRQNVNTFAWWWRSRLD